LDTPVCALVVNHLAHHHGQHELSDSAIRRLARKLAPATIDDLAAVMRADANGRPPIKSPDIHALIDALVAKAHVLQLADSAPKPILLGRHLLALGMKAGPAMKPVLDAAFEAQLDGAFHDEAGAIAWAKERVR
jgi:tRNA nucleotidyltransferase (CCA-adding enzyme)